MSSGKLAAKQGSVSARQKRPVIPKPNRSFETKKACSDLHFSSQLKLRGFHIRVLRRDQRQNPLAQLLEASPWGAAKGLWEAGKCVAYGFLQVED